MSAFLPNRVAQIVTGVAMACDVSPDVILSKSQEPIAVAARREVCAKLREEGFSYVQIGKWVRRHHTSVISLLMRYAKPDPVPGYDRSRPDESGVWAI